jgi:predicted RNA methylase
VVKIRGTLLAEENRKMTARTVLTALALILGLTLATAAQQAQAPLRTPDVIFVPTPQEVVDVMLKLAKVTKDDVVYDLGSGDGRIPITAAKVYGARAVGIDIDPERIRDANENLKTTAAADRTIISRVKFLNQDLFTTDISEATVVTLYLLPSLNLKLLPKLNKELKPGTRVVSHAFDMGPDIKPKMDPVNVNGRTVYYYTVPIQ